MEGPRCAACGEGFRRCPRVREQKYCGKEECRRTRRRRWQRTKRQVDADYRDNQERAQRAWARESSAYWRTYRSEHPDYVEENRKRTKERKRDGQRRSEGEGRFAKMDSIGNFSSVPSGTYLLVPRDEEKFAKMDSIMVKITLISED